ncbi:zinc finger protein 287-like isoform X2 [Bombyx mandarina]|uniref:Zinc finger protein 287-like isoform X2 n=1 Tax=Bombyx mandarina TaxID=7092 RepID=A0A6J2JP83_BOMMA|nr:zinc finger protein 287-like isoform X2 [Bombyx mandarina]
MALDSFNNLRRSLCGGCLSSDRKLSETNYEYKHLFGELVGSTNQSAHTSLCWECIKKLKNIRDFKGQARKAQDQLLQLVKEPLFTLSKLKFSKTDNIDVLAIKRNNKLISKDNKLIANKKRALSHHNGPEITSAFGSVNPDSSFLEINTFDCDDGDDSTNSKVPVHSNDDEGNETKPLAFIKVEYSDSENILSEFADEGLTNDGANAVTKAKCNKVRSKRRNRTADEFDESDDEPLTKKSRSKTDTVAPKLDRRKNPGPKREKPPGVVNNSRVRKKLEQLNVRADLLEMVVLSWEEVAQERRVALDSAAFTRHDYRCADCIVGFNHKSKLLNHMKKHDPSSGSLVCDICKVRCKDNNAYSAHRRRHRVRWRCRACLSAWSRAAVGADHCARAHGAPPPTHTCRVCGRTETSLGRLRSHVQEHAERQRCELCGKTFRDKTSLRTHLFIHKGEKDFECNKCGKRFVFKKAMEIHMITHNASSLLYCHHCDMNFKNEMSYYQHMKYNLKHVDPAKLKYACELCDKKFVKAARLEEHNMAVHLKIAPIRCSVSGCEFACPSRAALRTHTRRTHRLARALRNHVCHACGKAYTTKKTLEGHVRSHTGERPFACTRCPSTFRYEAALYNHNKLVHAARQKT